VDDFVVGAAVPGFVFPVTAHAENLPYNYTAFFGDEFETGDGTYDIATITLTRDTVLASSNNDQFVNFSGNPTVIMTYATEQPRSSGTLLSVTPFLTAQVGTVIPIPLLAHSCKVRLWGGTGASGSFGPGPGGPTGGAGYLEKLLTGLESAKTLTLQVGAAGVGGAGAGGNGTATILSSGTQAIPTLTANGSLGTPANTMQEGVGATATGGDVNLTGTNGRTITVIADVYDSVAGMTKGGMSLGAVHPPVGGNGISGSDGGAILEWYS
jgi:hypothetical protein